MNQTKYQALLLGTDTKLAETVALVVRSGRRQHRLCRQLRGRVAGAANASAGSRADGFENRRKPTASTCCASSSIIRPPAPVFTIALAPGGETTPVLRAFDLGLNEFIQTARLKTACCGRGCAA